LITAQKNPFLDSLLYHGYLRWSLRRSFHAIHARGMEHLESLPATSPVIACANHSNWWDGLIIFFLTRTQRKKEFYCMMDEKQLRHYRFFSWLGAFSVDSSNSLRAAAAVRYSLNLLKRGRTMLWIFPQGRQAPPHERIRVRPGADFLCHRTPHALVMPVAFRFVFLREQRPEVLIHVGRPFPALEASDERIENEIQTLCDALDADIRGEHWLQYRPLLAAGWSVNKLWEAFLRVLRGDWRGFSAQN
jgi:1-acyl-sn-glycerol-3-phosphate acyltransferase